MSMIALPALSTIAAVFYVKILIGGIRFAIVVMSLLKEVCVATSALIKKNDV